MKIDEKNVSIDDILKLLGLYCQQKGKKYDLNIGSKGGSGVKISNDPIVINFDINRKRKTIDRLLKQAGKRVKDKR